MKKDKCSEWGLRLPGEAFERMFSGAGWMEVTAVGCSPRESQFDSQPLRDDSELCLFLVQGIQC